MAILHRIRGTDAPNRRGDVIFVHGLDGHWRTTWSNGNDEGYWPEWLAQDNQELGIWSVEYEAASSGWRGDAMPIVDRASNLLDALLNEDLAKPLIFVTHSMGGLIVKQMLRYANDTQTYRELLRATRGVIFLSTPHSGSDVASLTRYFALVLRRTDALADLQANAATLRDLNRWYQNNASTMNISTKIYFEKQDTYGQRIVDETSADVHMVGVDAIPIDADHSSVSKPASKDDQVYKGSRKFIENLVGAHIEHDPPTLLRNTIDTRRLVPVYNVSSGGNSILVAYILRDDPEG